MEACAVICRKATFALLDANYLSSVPIPGFSSTKSGFLCAFASKFFPIMFFMGSLSAASSRWGYPPQRRQSLRLSAPASNIFPMALCHGCASHKELRHGAPASNKPHLAEKSTPVWLAICHTWAGFAISQLWRTTFHSTYSYECTSTLLPLGAAART